MGPGQFAVGPAPIAQTTFTQKESDFYIYLLSQDHGTMINERRHGVYRTLGFFRCAFL